MPDGSEIEDLKKFDSDEWTDKLKELSLDELCQIIDSGKFKVCVERVRDLAKALDRAFVGKTDLIDMMMISTMAQLPLLMLGTWGTGKSMLVRQMSQGLGISPKHHSIDREDDVSAQILGEQNGSQQMLATLFSSKRRYFEYLVTRFTTPEEILGGVNIDVMLKQSLHLRNTRGFLPRAEVVFLDEVFKANSSILNTLLSVINERLIYNAGVPWLANLVMLFGASNEPPQEEDLGAFYDRFPVRILCDRVADDDESVRELLRRAHAHAIAPLVSRGSANGGGTKKGGDPLKRIDPGHVLEDSIVEQRACVNDFRLLNKVALVKFGGADVFGKDSRDFQQSFIAVFRGLRIPYDISDRSCGHFYRLARARAIYNQRDELRPDDCRVFYYCSKDKEAVHKLPGLVDELIDF